MVGAAGPADVVADAGGGGVGFGEVVVVVAVGAVDVVTGTDDAVLETVGSVVNVTVDGGITSGAAAVVEVGTDVVVVDVDGGGDIVGGCSVEDGSEVGAAAFVFSAGCWMLLLLFVLLLGASF